MTYSAVLQHDSTNPTIHPDDPDSPDSPDSPDDDPGVGSDMYSPLYGGYIPAQVQIEEAMGTLETSLNITNGTGASGGDMSRVVEAILVAPTCTPMSNEYVSQPASITQPCTPTSFAFTPTTTLPATEYAACTDYARILSSCASATPSFYSLPASQQASCACYTAATSNFYCSLSPTTVYAPDPTVVTDGKRPAVFPSLAAGRLDNAAAACYDYFSLQGYVKIADVISGVGKGNVTQLGFGFCENVGRELSAGALQTGGVAASGLPNRLGVSNYGECTPSYSVHSGGSRTEGLTTFDRVVLPFIPVSLAAFFYGLS